MNIAICDDDSIMRRYLQNVTERELHAKADLYASGEALLAAEAAYDLILLDNCLDGDGKKAGMNGIETARTLRLRSEALLIFITAIGDYVYDAYDVEAFHYLLKPVDEAKLCEVLRRAADKIKEKRKDAPLLVRTNGKYIRIQKEDIFYAESDGRKIILHTRNGVVSYYEKMERLEETLGSGFFRSHRGYLVNLDEVLGYDRTGITLKCGDAVFLARQKYNDFVAAYMEYLI